VWQHQHFYPAPNNCLVADDDARTALDPISGANRYGCGLNPDPAIAAFGTSTASVISLASLATTERLCSRLAEAPDTLRQEFPVMTQYGLASIDGL